MIKITKNPGDMFEVTKGAYDSVFKHQGYTKIDESNPLDDGQMSMDDMNQDGSKDETEDEKFLRELVEKPISQWTKNEVKKYVDLKGIDTYGASTLTEVKELIKVTLS